MTSRWDRWGDFPIKPRPEHKGTPKPEPAGTPTPPKGDKK